jgi:hypothetical protein
MGSKKFTIPSWQDAVATYDAAIVHSGAKGVTIRAQMQLKLPVLLSDVVLNVLSHFLQNRSTDQRASPLPWQPRR